MIPARRRAVEQGHEPVKALELKMAKDAPIVINVRLAGYACCSVDHSKKQQEKRGNALAHEERPGLACPQVEVA